MKKTSCYKSQLTLIVLGLIVVFALVSRSHADNILDVGYEDPTYSIGDISGQDGWSIIDSNGTAEVVSESASPTGSAPEGNQLLELDANDNAAVSAAKTFATQTEPFTMSFEMAYDAATDRGRSHTVYIGNTSDRFGGVNVGFDDVGTGTTDLFVTDADGKNLFGEGLAEEDTFYRFDIDIRPAEQRYDVNVYDADGFVAGSSDNGSRNSIDSFDRVIFSNFVGEDGTDNMFVDNVFAIPEPSTLVLLGLGGLLLMKRRRM